MVNWLPIAILAGAGLALAIVGLVLHGLYSRVFARIHQMELKYLDRTSTRIIEAVLKASILVFVIYGFGLALYLSDLWSWFSDTGWDWMVQMFLPVLTIAVIVLTAVIVGRIIDRLFHRLADPFIGERSLMSKNLAALLSILSRYLLYVAALLLSGLVAAISLGYGGDVVTFASDFLLTNITTLVFLATIAIIGYAAWRFLSGFFTELGTKSKRFSPQVFRMAEVGSKAIVVVISALLVVFLILRSMGLGDLAQTVVLLATFLIGLIVSLSGSGSIGNALSGLVLIVFSPFEEGDMVEVTATPGGPVFGEVVTLGIIFSEIRDNRGLIHDIPNNVLLAGALVNQTDSVPYAITIPLGLGYDLSHEQVEKLCMEAALKTDDILETPEPHLYLLDFPAHYVDYAFHAYTERTDRLRIRSDLMKNIKSTFDAAGVEILSPVHEVAHPGFMQRGGILQPDD